MRNNPILIYTDFRKLFLARVTSAIGDKFFTLSLLWWLISFENGKILVSLSMAFTFLPSVIFSTIAGALSDRHNKKYLMLFADFTRAFILTIVLLLYISSILSPYILLIFVFVLYSFAPLFETSTASSIPLVVSKQHLSSAVAIDSSSIGISNVLGAMLGSIFIAVLGFKGAIIFNIVTYLLSFAFVFFINRQLTTNVQNNSFLDDIKQGLRYISKEKTNTLKLLIFFAFINLFISPILILIPVAVKFILNEDVKWFAIIETFFASGTILGAFIMSFKKDIKNNIIILMLTIFLFSVSYFIIAFSKNAILTSLMGFLCGFSISVGNVSIISYFQYLIDDEYKGRFFSLVNVIVYAVMPLSFIVNGFLIEAFEPQKIIIVNSTLSFIFAIYGFIKFRNFNK